MYRLSTYYCVCLGCTLGTVQTIKLDCLNLLSINDLVLSVTLRCSISINYVATGLVISKYIRRCKFSVSNKADIIIRQM